MGGGRYSQRLTRAANRIGANPGGSAPKGDEFLRIFGSAMKETDNAVDFWTNMTEEQQARFLETGQSIYELYDYLKTKVDTSTPEWKEAAPGDHRDFAIRYDFSNATVNFNLVPARSSGWQADANRVGEINVRSDGIEGDWRYVIAHELGHQLSNMSPKLATAILTNPGNVLGRYNNRMHKFVGLSYNPEESWADAVGYYFSHREMLRQRHPEAYRAVRAFLRASPSAEKYIEDGIRKYKQMAKL